MVKVIKRGTPPRERRFQPSCYKCYSVLEFTAAEANLMHIKDGPMREEAWFIKCPVCEYRVFAYLNDEVVQRKPEGKD